MPISSLLVEFHLNILPIQALATFQTLLQSLNKILKSLPRFVNFSENFRCATDFKMVLDKLDSLDMRILYPSFQFNIYIFRALTDSLLESLKQNYLKSAQVCKIEK